MRGDAGLRRWMRRHPRWRQVAITPANRPGAKLFARHWRGAGGVGVASTMGLPGIMNGFPIITVLTVTPLVGAVLLLVADAGQQRLARQIALAFSILGLFWAGLLWANFDPTATGLQFVKRHTWFPTLAPTYFLD